MKETKFIYICGTELRKGYMPVLDDRCELKLRIAM